MRAIADVATAVTKGDLTRSVTEEARGEVADLKDNINEMISNLRETTNRNTEQDWLKTNLARFTRMLQGQRDMITVSRMLMSELAPIVNAQHGVFYLMEQAESAAIPTRAALAGGATTPIPEGTGRLRLLSSYAYKDRKNVANAFALGEGLVGQAALEKQRILLSQVPGDYIQVASGLGEAAPLNIVVLPVVFEGAVKAVIELASFNRFSETFVSFLEQLTESIGIVLNTIEANAAPRTAQQSQSSPMNASQQMNCSRPTGTGRQGACSKNKDRSGTQEPGGGTARGALDEKAEQLAVSSKYKSEFLANMSHDSAPRNLLILPSKARTPAT